MSICQISLYNNFITLNYYVKKFKIKLFFRRRITIVPQYAKSPYLSYKILQITNFANLSAKP